MKCFVAYLCPKKKYCTLLSKIYEKLSIIVHSSSFAKGDAKTERKKVGRI
jgi:hypothetical protein